MLDCNILVSEFELKSCYVVDFRIFLGRKPLFRPSYPLILQG